jgi:recombinational DNA repair protein (RecF pathway)
MTQSHPVREDDGTRACDNCGRRLPSTLFIQHEYLSVCMHCALRTAHRIRDHHLRTWYPLDSIHGYEEDTPSA